MRDTEVEITLTILQPDELDAPREWPDEIGVAFLEAPDGSPEAYPFHTSEETADIISRIRASTPVDLDKAYIYPEVDGHLALDVSVADAMGLTSEVEKALMDNPEFMEEAHDFAINFEFSKEYGVPVHGITSPAPEEFEAESEPDPSSEHGYGHEAPGQFQHVKTVNPPVSRSHASNSGGLAGYHDLDQEDGLAKKVPVQVSRKGVITINFATSILRGRPSKVKPLVRPDRSGVAFSVKDITDEKGGHMSVELPAGCLSSASLEPGKTYLADVTLLNGYVVVTPIFWRDAPVATIGGLSRLIVIACALIVMGALIYSLMGTFDQERSSDPAERLQESMFGDTSKGGAD